MFGRIRKMLKNKKGFTLVELIVVVAIIGILAAIAVPRITGFTDDAKEKADSANLRMIQNAVEMYTAQNNELPDTSTKMGSMVEKYLNDEVPSPQEDSDDVFVMDDSTGRVSIKASAGDGETAVKSDD